ncbi:uncharacterized protein LOC111053969 [Nilaparvata lugens]|uniref:uncharacterized protein LOC111053969 n=1 Tax=Nilaparvata lugens TaxID=108931 RepID=UPI00193D9678|nr:uncharacterized protein LOC111053969 [Nilaparvata lugens]
MPPPSVSTSSPAGCLLAPLLTLLVLGAVPPHGAYAAPASSLKYDQSQAGDYNVQVHLKNIEVYAILDDSSFGNEQYDYDYADMTLKVTFSPPSKAPGGGSAPEDHSSAPMVAGGASDNIDVTTNTVASTSATSRTTKRCGAGFYRDHFGRCRRVRHPQLPLLSLSHLQRKNNGKTPSSTLSSISSFIDHEFSD